MKTSKKTLVFASAVLTVAAFLIIVGVVNILGVLKTINPFLHIIVVGLLIFALIFWFIYSSMTDAIKRHDDEYDDDDDDDEDDDPELPVAHIGILRQKTCAADYEVINDEEKELTTEFFSLDERISKTEKMIKDNDYKGTDVAKLALLFAQLNTMKRYFMLLATRMENQGIIKYNK